MTQTAVSIELSLKKKLEKIKEQRETELGYPVTYNHVFQYLIDLDQEKKK